MLFYWWGNWDSEKLRNPSKVTQRQAELGLPHTRNFVPNCSVSLFSPKVHFHLKRSWRPSEFWIGQINREKSGAENEWQVLLKFPGSGHRTLEHLPQEAERNLKFPQRVGPQMQEEHFPHWYFKTISQSPNRQPHAITDQKAKSASLDCVCVCIKTQIIRFEGKSDSQQNSLRWHCGFWPCLRREEDRLISDKSYLFDHQIWGENISLRQAQNVIYKDRLCSSNTNKCEINRKAGTSIVFTFCIEYFGCYDVTSWNIKKGRFHQDNNTKMLTRFFLLLFIWFSFLLKEYRGQCTSEGELPNKIPGIQINTFPAPCNHWPKSRYNKYTTKNKYTTNTFLSMISQILHGIYLYKK